MLTFWGFLKVLGVVCAYAAIGILVSGVAHWLSNHPYKNDPRVLLDPDVIFCGLFWPVAITVGTALFLLYGVVTRIGLMVRRIGDWLTNLENKGGERNGR